MNKMTLEINSENFENLVLKSDKPVMVDVWAEWCGPCRAIAPYIEQIAEEYADRAVVGKVDIEQNSEIANKYAVRNIPTLLFFNNGELVDKHVGLAAKTLLVSKLDALL